MKKHLIFAGKRNYYLNAMKQAILKTIEQNDNVSLYSICFDGNNEKIF